MVKLVKAFSIFAVLTLLILLAPAVILAPGGNVAAADEDVVQEVEANFSFSESAGGDWYTFTAGSGGLEGIPPRLCLAQFTRENVVRNATLGALAGCGFRNYTTGSGSVSGDLSGTLSLSLLAITFNQKYSHTPLYEDYGSGAHFGWMTGRGHIGEDLTFVYIIDFDSDDATMSNAVGKGFLMSVDETGAFAGHKIIGDFEITKSGADYSGTFHLRNYAPNEVYDLGALDVSGGVLQEATDDISAGSLELLKFTEDGSMSTPPDDDWPTAYEEVDWGRDPIKTVTAGRLGANGTMDISRGNVLYLNQTVVVGGDTWVTIQGTPVCNLYINDTNEGVRLDDGSPYGELWELLVLQIPQQYEKVNTTVPNYFWQYGYTFTPFGLLHEATGCYAGTESYADAYIGIQVTVGQALQQSTDQSYGLYPHPKVASVIPASASPGATNVTVTITGKYFLRADDYVPNSGSLDFGEGITVNSYTIGNASPIDNEITADISIAGDAAGGTRNVSVTSCFNYTAGSGAAPYKTGTLVDGFEVVEAGSSLDGHVGLGGLAATNVTVRFFTAGTTSEVMKKYGTTDASGNFTISGITPGTYDVGVKGSTSLSKLVAGVTFSSATAVDFGALSEGDSSNDDYIDASDYAALSAAWLSWPGQPNWDANADYSRDDYVDASDYALLSFNWLKWGACFGWPGNWN